MQIAKIPREVALIILSYLPVRRRLTLARTSDFLNEHTSVSFFDTTRVLPQNGFWGKHTPRTVEQWEDDWGVKYNRWKDHPLFL
jgi:hypothetical protein